jgi:hypothetical protein
MMATSWADISLAQILKSFTPRVTSEALSLCALNQVQKSRCVDNFLEGEVVEKGQRYATSIEMDADGTLHMSCECGRMRESPCVHAIALMITQVSRNEVLNQGPNAPIPSAAPAQPTPSGLSPFLTATPQEISADWKRRLQSLTVKDMRDICAAWGAKVKGSLREQVTDGLIEMVMRPGALAQVVERLQPDTRRVLDVLCALAHPSPNFNFDQISPYLDAVLASSGSKPRPLQECLEGLTRLGLVRTDYTPHYLVPLQVVAQLPPDPTLFKILEGETKRITPAKPFQFTRLTLRLLLMAQNKLLICAPAARIVTKSGWVLRAEADQDSLDHEILPETGYLADNLRASLAATLDKPPELIDLAARLLDSSNMWAPRAPEKIHNQMHAWMELSPQEQSRRLFALFAGFPTQMELDLARQTGFAPNHNARGNPGYKDFLKMLGIARLRLVRLLMLAPAGQWLEVESILQMLHALQPGWWLEFNSRQKDAYNQQIWVRTPVWASAGRKRIDPLVYADWRKAYGQFYLSILTRSLLWLGLVDVAWREDQPLAVRLAEFGEFLLNRRPDFALPAPQAGQQALFQHPDGTFELDLDLAAPDLINLLMLIAAPVTDKVKTGSAIPRRLSYRISEGGLGTAFEAGWTVEQIITRLQSATSNPLSAWLVQRLQAIWDHFGRLQIYEDMALIEFADDYCLPELLAGTQLSQILLYTFSPRLIAVRPEAVNQFMADLQAKGYTPRLEGGSRA